MPDSMIVVHSSTLKRCLWKSSITRSSSRSGIWPWAMPMRASGTSSSQLALHAADGLDVVVQEVHLAAARELALERLAQQRVVPRRDEGLHREAVRRRRGDDRQVAQAGHRHVERARDRRGGQRQQVHVGAQRLQRLLLAHAEALFLVDDHQAQVLEAHVALQQAVGADDRRRSCLRPRLASSALISLVDLEARQHLDPDRPVGEAVAEVAVVLLGQQRGRHQHRDLLAARGGDEGRAHRDFGLAEADVAADHAVHRLRWTPGRGSPLRSPACWSGVSSNGNVAANGSYIDAIDVDAPGRRAPGAWPGSPAVRRRRRGPSRRPCAWPWSHCSPPSECSGAVSARGAGVAADQVQLRDRHVQAVALGVLDLQVFAGHAAGFERDQAAVAADAVVLVHDRRAFGQLAQVADDRFGLAPGALAPASWLAGALGEQLAFGEHGERAARVEREAVVQRRDGDREARRRRPTNAGQPGSTVGLQPGGLQQFAAALRAGPANRRRSARGPDSSTGTTCSAAAGRRVLRRDRQRRRGLVAQRRGAFALRMRRRRRPRRAAPWLSCSRSASGDRYSSAGGSSGRSRSWRRCS